MGSSWDEEQEREKLKKELQRLKQEKQRRTTSSDSGDRPETPDRNQPEPSRRQFLKKAGAIGAAGLGASLFAKNASAFDVRSDNPFRFRSLSGDTRFEVETDGTLNLNENDITSIDAIEGNLTGNEPLTDIAGNNLSIEDGTLNASVEGGETDTLATHHVFVYQTGSNSYEAVDDTGAEIASGSDGPSVLQSAFDACPSEGSVYVEGEYTFTSTGDQVEFGDGKHMWAYNATFYHEYESSTPAIVFANGSEGTTVDITSSVEDVNNVEVSDSSAFSEGDLVRLQQDVEVSPTSTYLEGELLKIETIEGNTLHLTKGVYFDYDPSDDATAQQISPDTGHIHGATMIGEWDHDNDQDQIGFGAYRAKDCVVEDLHIERIGEKGVDIIVGYGCTLRNSYIGIANYRGDGYGIRLRHDNTDMKIHDNYFDFLRHGIASSSGDTSAGRLRSTMVWNNIFVGTYESHAIDAHMGHVDMHIHNNLIYGAQAGIGLGCKHASIIGNVFFGFEDERDGSHGRFLLATSRNAWHDIDWFVANNYIANGHRHCIFLRHLDSDGPHTGTFNNVTIQDNYFKNPRHTSITIRARINSLNIVGNTWEDLEGRSSPVIRIDHSDYAEVGSGRVSDNALVNLSSFFWWHDSGGDYIENFEISRNHINNPQTSGPLFQFELLQNSIICDNTIHDENGNLGTVFDFDTGTENNLIKGNRMFHDGSVTLLNDSGSNNTTDDNWTSTGSGWSGS